MSCTWVWVSVVFSGSFEFSKKTAIRSSWSFFRGMGIIRRLIFRVASGVEIFTFEYISSWLDLNTRWIPVASGMASSLMAILLIVNSIRPDGTLKKSVASPNIWRMSNCSLTMIESGRNEFSSTLIYRFIMLLFSSRLNRRKVSLKEKGVGR